MNRLRDWAVGVIAGIRDWAVGMSARIRDWGQWVFEHTRYVIVKLFRPQQVADVAEAVGLGEDEEQLEQVPEIESHHPALVVMRDVAIFVAIAAVVFVAMWQFCFNGIEAIAKSDTANERRDFQAQRDIQGAQLCEQRLAASQALFVKVRPKRDWCFKPQR